MYLNLFGYQYLERMNLFKIEGFSHPMFLAVICEIDLDEIKKRLTVKYSSNWLGMIPDIERNKFDYNFK